MPKLTPTFNDDKKLAPSPVPLHLPSFDPAKENGKAKEDAPTTNGKAAETPKAAEEWKAAIPGMPTRKVALVGTAPSSRLLAPFNDPSWTIWGCSPGNMNLLPRVDAWFEIHSTLHYPENQHYGLPYINWLKAQSFPVWMQDKRYCPNALAYPRAEMEKEFTSYFFTSSFSWMLAMAIKYGAQEIGLFGIDMASRDEYILQRPGAYYFFIEAGKRGIKIMAPYESDIMQPPPSYGFCDSTPFFRKLTAREKELRDRVTEMRGQRESLEKSITYLEGAMEDLDYVKNIWGGAQDVSGNIIEIKSDA